MMSYTMECTSLCDSGGILMRFMSPSTRIIGGTPEDRCRSEALFLTAKARSCAISTAIDSPGDGGLRCGKGTVQVCPLSAPAGERRGHTSNMLMGPQNLPE